jgi:hypothetical protein
MRISIRGAHTIRCFLSSYSLGIFDFDQKIKPRHI